MKTELLLAMVLLAGCASKSVFTPVPSLGSAQTPDTDMPGWSPEAAASVKNDRKGPYTKGKSTEDELFAARGQPMNRTVAADGTRTDIYKTPIVHLDGSSGTVKIVEAPLPGGDPDIRTHYIYSADGILRQIMIDTVTKGPNGEEQHNITENHPGITITARRVVSSGSSAENESP